MDEGQGPGAELKSQEQIRGASGCSAVKGDTKEHWGWPTGPKTPYLGKGIKAQKTKRVQEPTLEQRPSRPSNGCAEGWGMAGV